MGRILMALLALLLVAGCGSGGADDAEINVSVVCEQWVADALRSPGTASFEPFPEQQITAVDDTTYRVLGWVDSQNGFGGTVRADYVCEAEMVEAGNPNGRWSPVEVDVQERR